MAHILFMLTASEGNAEHSEEHLSAALKTETGDTPNFYEYISFPVGVLTMFLVYVTTSEAIKDAFYSYMKNFLRQNTFRIRHYDNFEEEILHHLRMYIDPSTEFYESEIILDNTLRIHRLYSLEADVQNLKRAIFAVNLQT